MIWIAVDAMGGDFAPAHVVDGALAAARHLDLGVVLVGRAGAIEAELARYPDLDRSHVTVVDAPEHLRLVTVRFDVPRSQSITVCLPLEVLEAARILEGSPGSNE